MKRQVPLRRSFSAALLAAQHSFRFLFLALVGLAVFSQSAAAQDSGLHLRLLLSPEPGKVRALVEVDSKIPIPNLSAADFSLLLDNGVSGPARSLVVSRNGDRAGMLTLVVLDDSGSYRSGPSKTLAHPAIFDYARLLAPRDRIGLVVFGADASSYPIRSSASDFLADVDDPQRNAKKNRHNLRATNLLSGLAAALATIKKEQDEQRALPGLSEILLFTDAEDEAAVDNQDWSVLFADAVKRTIRISSVVSTVSGSSDTKRLTTLTRLRELADQTHGSYDNSDNLNQLSAQLRDARDALKSWILLEGALCGIKPGASSADARVDYAPAGVRNAWTESRAFAPQWTAGSETPCIAASCTPLCEDWQQCTGGKCAARSCTAHENCGSRARCVNGACSLPPATADRNSLLVVAAVFGGLLLLALAALLFFGRRKPVEPEPTVEPPLPPAPPEPALAAGVAKSEAPPEAGPPPLNPLPETLLQAIGGAARPGEKWRLHKPKMYVGGSGDPSDGNDIVFAISAVSSRHALFELFPSGDLWLTDLNSRNGTFVNGQRLEPNQRLKLRVGDQVKLSQQLVLQVLRPGVEPVPHRAAAEAAPQEAGAASLTRKKQTIFDPGNR